MTLADPVAELMERHRALCEGAVHPLEIAAVLEAEEGIGPGTAARYRHADVFSLAEELHARVPSREAAPPAPPRARAVRAAARTGLLLAAVALLVHLLHLPTPLAAPAFGLAALALTAAPGIARRPVGRADSGPGHDDQQARPSAPTSGARPAHGSAHFARHRRPAAPADGERGHHDSRGDAVPASAAAAASSAASASGPGAAALGAPVLADTPSPALLRPATGPSGPQPTTDAGGGARAGEAAAQVLYAGLAGALVAWAWVGSGAAAAAGLALAAALAVAQAAAWRLRRAAAANLAGAADRTEFRARMRSALTAVLLADAAAVAAAACTPVRSPAAAGVGLALALGTVLWACGRPVAALVGLAVAGAGVAAAVRLTSGPAPLLTATPATTALALAAAPGVLLLLAAAARLLAPEAHHRPLPTDAPC